MDDSCRFSCSHAYALSVLRKLPDEWAEALYNNLKEFFFRCLLFVLLAEEMTQNPVTPVTKLIAITAGGVGYGENPIISSVSLNLS